MDFQMLLQRYQAIDEYFEQEFPQLQGEYKLLARLGKITEELGELNSAVHGNLNLHRQDKQTKHDPENVAREWADVFNTLMLFGLVLDLDFQTVIESRLNEIDARYKLYSPNKRT